MMMGNKDLFVFILFVLLELFRYCLSVCPLDFVPPSQCRNSIQYGTTDAFFWLFVLFHFSHFFFTYAQKEGKKVLLLLLLFFLKPSSGSVWHRHEHSHNQPECASFCIEMKAGNTHTHLYTHACTRQQQEHTNKQAQTHREEAQAIWHSLSV